MNSQLVELLVKVLGTTLILMAVIMLCCVATPHLAKWIDKLRGADKKDDEPPTDPNEPHVQGPYDASHDEEYDLNYKIYNTDIYGVEFKHGKKRKKLDGGSDNLDG